MVQIIISFDDQRHIIAKPASYEILLELARAYFSIAGDSPLFVRYFSTAGAKSIELVPAGYETVSDCSYVTFSLTPAVDGEDVGEGEDDDIQALDKRPRRRDYPRRITISIRDFLSSNDSQTIFVVSPRVELSELKRRIAEESRKDRERILLFYKSAVLLDDSRLSDHNIHNGSTIDMHYLHVGSKPATYLLSPTALKDMYARIILCSSWSFSVVDPVVDVIKDPEWSSVSWDINIPKNGGIKHKYSRYPCDHLSWQAVCHGKYPELTSNDGMGTTVLAFDDLLPYLDEILPNLCLTRQMCMDFLGYWLFSFQTIRDAGLHIKFRFLSLYELSKMATLVIGGREDRDATSRVFLLFGGTQASADYDSLRALEVAREIDWAKEIGLDISGMRDEDAFRVIEWGGMEVPYTHFPREGEEALPVDED